jgi:hypothetical protein
MAAILVIGGVILATIVIIQLQKWTGRAINKGDQLVRGSTWKKSQLEANTGFSLWCPVAAGEALDAIVQSVNPYEKAPAVVDGTYLKRRTQSMLLFALGNKINGDRFVAVVEMTDSPDDGGSEGAFVVARWQAMGAELVGKDALKRLRGRIQNAVQDLGGEVEELVDPELLRAVNAAAAPELTDFEVSPDEESERWVDPESSPRIESGDVVDRLRTCENCGSEFTPVYRGTSCPDCGGQLTASAG